MAHYENYLLTSWFGGSSLFNFNRIAIFAGKDWGYGLDQYSGEPDTIVLDEFLKYSILEYSVDESVKPQPPMKTAARDADASVPCGELLGRNSDLRPS